MKTINIIYLFSLILVFSSCVEEFTPEVYEEADLLVVQGSIIKGEDTQLIEITRSTSFYNPEEKPVSGCYVRVMDDKGNGFVFSEDNSGNYTANIPQQYLNYNSSFKLFVTTPDKKYYESELETILEGSPVDTVYYATEDYQSSSVYYSEGIQLYLDLSAPNENTRHYRWTVEETWEYRSKFFIDATWDEELDTVYIHRPRIADKYFCWNTMDVNGFYSASTENLTVNERKKIPLNYLAGNDPKLNYSYCALVKQYTLGDKAYEYWNTNKVESSESGGLYQTQPSQSRSNIVNINDPDEIVLGFFWVSSFTEKRMFFQGPFKNLNYQYACEADTLVLDDIGILYTNKYYTILYENPDTVIWGTAWTPCLDCTAQGGTNEKPDYWEDK